LDIEISLRLFWVALIGRPFMAKCPVYSIKRMSHYGAKCNVKAASGRLLCGCTGRFSAIAAGLSPAGGEISPTT
jgi:hypothetical protein